MIQETTFQRKLREKREAVEREAAEIAAQAAAEAAEKAKWAQFVPENPYNRTESDQKIDELVAGISIIDAYNRWANKGKVTPRPGQSESIKVRCPNPAHPDNHPSAWLNTEKDVGTCATCGGFDPLHIAAWSFGFDMYTYQTGANFHRLRERIAMDYGFTVSKVGGETVIYRDPGPAQSGDKPGTSPNSGSQNAALSGKTDKSDTLQKAPPPENSDGQVDPPTADVVSISGELPEEDFFGDVPPLPWRKMVPRDSFIDVYMRQVCVNEAPEEYHFFSALLAIGFTLGRGVSLAQVGEPVYGNMFVCLLGPTGTGKSLSQRPLTELLRRSMPYSPDPGSTGCRQIKAPGSPEALIREFQKSIVNPLTMKPIPGQYESVHGLVDFNELSALIKTADRKGSAMKSVLMAFYDGDKIVSTVALSTGEKIAYEPYCSLITTTQPRSVRENLRQVDNSSGFLNRFVFVPGATKKRTYTAVPRVDIEPAVTPLQLIAGWAASLRGSEEITWTDEALERWANHFDERIWPYKHKEDFAILQRLELALMKIILLLSANKLEKRVTLETVEEAVLAHDFLVGSYHSLAEALMETLEEQIVKAIMVQLDRLDHDHKGLGVGKLWNAIKGKKFPREKFDRVLTILEKIGQIERFQSTGVGRPTEKVRRIA